MWQKFEAFWWWAKLKEYYKLPFDCLQNHTVHNRTGFVPLPPREYYFLARRDCTDKHGSELHIPYAWTLSWMPYFNSFFSFAGFWMSLHNSEMSHRALVSFLFCVMETYPKVSFVQAEVCVCWYTYQEVIWHFAKLNAPNASVFGLLYPAINRWVYCSHCHCAIGAFLD